MRINLPKIFERCSRLRLRLRIGRHSKPVKIGPSGNSGPEHLYEQNESASFADEDYTEPAIFNGWSSKDFVMGPPRAIKVDHGSGNNAAILLNIDLAKAMKTALGAHLDAQAVEADTDAEIAALSPRFYAVQQEMESLQTALAGRENCTNIASKQSELDRLSAEQDWILNRQAELRTRLQEQYEGMRSDQIELFDILKNCTSSEEPIYNPETEGVVVENGSSPTEHTDALGEENNVECPVATSAEGTDVEELRYNYNAFKEQLEEIELQFETRHRCFAQERFDAEKEQGQGETSSAIDARHIRQTQRLTRVLSQAEKEFQDAKDALLAAGYQPPGSDLSSGFIDDVDDGYRLSLENDMIEHADKRRIHDWLSNLPEPGPDISEVDIALPTPEVDHWEGDEVDICDSWSLVADGADRRRIDRWRVLATS